MNEYYVFGPERDVVDELYKAIIMLDKERIKELKADGVTLTENVRRVLKNGPSRSNGVIHPDYEFRAAFAIKIKGMPIEDYKVMAAMLRAEIGKPLHYSEALWLWENKRFFEPRFFEITLDTFNQKQMSKKKTMKTIIDKNALGCLSVCEKHGWLKMSKTRDELIEYANENGKTEAAAWLLDFKNRTADLSAERARAEKKTERELNADPNSLTELKKIWRFEKREDNTIIITGYKGGRTEITVPEKIGGYTVTALGEYAFSPDAKRIREEQRALRRAITKVTLPDTIESIGEFAFYKCRSLKEINIPEKLTEISKGMLDLTGLESIVIGGNVKKVGGVAFRNCYKLTALVYKGSYAEKYCEENKINYKYAEE